MSKAFRGITVIDRFEDLHEVELAILRWTAAIIFPRDQLIRISRLEGFGNRFVQVRIRRAAVDDDSLPRIHLVQIDVNLL